LRFPLEGLETVSLYRSLKFQRIDKPPFGADEASASAARHP
jgi:hypothetical protein